MTTNRKTLCAVAALTAAGIAWGQVPAVQRVPDGQIACHFFGRLNFDADRTARYIAYFSRIAGIPDTALFAGEEQTAQTAKLTVVSTPLRVNFVRDGLLFHGKPSPVSGDFVLNQVYFNELPRDRDFAEPDTFRNGRLVATFRSRNALLSAIPLLQATATAVLELVSSDDFFVQGQRVNLRDVAQAVRLSMTGGPTPEGRSEAPFLSFPVSGYGTVVSPTPAE
ncbi:MAG: hypothetical protein R2729_23020 [Bryobacteraceae bacterium]